MRKLKKEINILILCSLLSCTPKIKKEEPKIIYYPSKDLFTHANTVRVDLDNSSINFKELTNLVDDIHTINGSPYIEFLDNDTLKKILLFRNDGQPINSKDKLEISKDSVLSDDMNYSINKLYGILKEEYKNIGKGWEHPKDNNSFFVEIEIDTNQKAVVLEKTLRNLVRNFDEINLENNDTLLLNVVLSYFHQIPPPPPPKFKN